MMKNIFLLNLMIFILIPISSCQWYKNYKSHANCRISSPYRIQALSAGNWTGKFSFWIGANNELNDSSYQIGITESRLDAILLEKILTKFNFNLHLTEINYENISNIVMYVDARNKDSIISMKDILGTSIYYVYKEQFKVGIFEKKENIMSIIPNFNFNIKRTPVMDFYRTSQIFKKSIGDSIVALVIPSSNFNAKKWKEIQDNSVGDLSSKLNTYYEHKKSHD